MRRNLKVLGVVFVVIFALSAVVASAAMAENLKSTGTPTILHGEQTETHVFTTSAGSVTCEKATFEGTFEGTSVAEVSIHPTYTGCHLTFAEFDSATVTTTGCNYRFYNVVAKSGPVDIVCSGTNVIKVETLGCTIKVAGQTGLGTITYANAGSGSTADVNVTANVSGIHYSTSGFICGTHTETNGTYKGPTTMRAFLDFEGVKGIQRGISVG